MTNAECREPTQADRFYPGDPDTLQAVIRKGLESADAVAPDRPALGLVAPHAGYAFSGPTAAWAYRQAQGHPYRHVMVLAPSHYALLNGGSIFAGSRYRTPLGEIPMCAEVVGALRARADLFADELPAHREEHSLEVQLPFLQMVLGDFDLIPVVVSGSPGPNWMAVADALSEAIEAAGLRPGHDTLIVASSDLYHGPSADACEANDAALAAELERFDPEAFAKKATRRTLMACGAGPMAIMMRMVRRAGAQQMRILRQTNSQREYPVGADYVVGYMAAMAY